MRCYICNRVIDEPEFNSDHQDIDPCEPCKIVIEDTLAGFKDLPAPQPDEEDLLLVEGLFPTEYDPFETEDFT